MDIQQPNPAQLERAQVLAERFDSKIKHFGYDFSLPDKWVSLVLENGWSFGIDPSGNANS